MTKTIYYFSATGNSLQAALDIADGIGDADVVSISKAGMNATCDSDVIGFVFPCFAWGPPIMVREFIKTAAFNKDAYFFTVVTCGSGIGGSVSSVDALLCDKGAKLSYGAKLKSVSNYIVLYNVRTDRADETLANSDVALAQIIADLKENKAQKIGRGLGISNKLHRCLTKNYKIADKHYNISDACTSCGICVSVCPARNIEIADGKPTFKHNCEHCVACIHWCPQKALNYGNKTQTRNRYHHPKIKPEQLP
ncbi:MAG: EFR1 family ferrodoxin [Oscillospiraceae bacterium]|nr:EFR1 family ferrodoxin [Oscillospiraceae bacterium]